MMRINRKMLAGMALIAAILAWVVIVYGAYTRITDAGLACPDWPGCYGQLVVPEGQDIAAAEAAFPHTPVEAKKAWTEMIHRYLAGTVGLFILALTIGAYRIRREVGNKPFYLGLAMIALLFCQVILGKWTVTMRLMPWVVTSHLTFGMTLLCLLWVMAMCLSPCQHLRSIQVSTFTRYWAGLTFVMVALQVISGGWTSTNMAGHICSGYPVCADMFLSQFDWHAATRVDQPLGQMPMLGLMAVTSFHRVGSVFILFFVGSLSMMLAAFNTKVHVRILGVLMLCLLLFQMILGFMNIPASRAVWAATAHNGLAAGLLILVLTAWVSALLSRSYHVKN